MDTFLKILAKRYKTKKTGIYYKEIQKTVIDDSGKSKVTILKDDRVYSIQYKDIDSKWKFKTIGKYSEGIRENFCHNKRIEILNMVKLGEQPEIIKKKQKKNTLTLNQLAKIYFDDKRCLKCENCKAFNKLKDNEKTTSKDLECLDRRVKHQRNKYLKHIAPKFGVLDFETITKEDIVKKRKFLIGEGRAENSINGIIQLMSTIINYSIKEKGLKITNPCIGVKSLDTDNDRERYLTVDEVKRLLHSIEDNERLKLFVMLSLSTGGRLQTILNIKKKDINLSHSTITLKDLKNNSTYTGFMDGSLKELLEEQIKHLTADTYIIGGKLTSLSVNALSSELRPILNRLFNEGLSNDDRKNRAVIHTLRHTFASNLAINGVPILTIKNLLNHKDIKMTLRYAKLAPDSGLEAVKELYR